ncbi:hypothetical protein AALP_AA5G227800 [Arabis alpina]|uniref:MATH domain-containing protein n=1 Tax=Arabis alpina TaxID=50452 RepID=A0A087GYU7_ARAAL|nr:hypothetical protein AALP_AA5G227800 [Arabis alpina]
MGNLVDNKFTWTIKNFSSLGSEKVCSDQFVIGGCKWELLAYPKGDDKVGYLCLCLAVTESESRPCGWRRHAKFSFTLVNQHSEKLSRKTETRLWFDEEGPIWGFSDIILLTKLHERDRGFLVNRELKITVEIDVLEVIGRLDESEESEEGTTQPLKKIKKDNDGIFSSEVNGFLVLPSQAESVKRIFEKHPNMALNCRAKNQYLRTLCMNALLNLIQTMCQSLQELSIDDLSQADDTLTYLKNSGFKVDWLERKLEEVKEKKMEKEIGETRMQELEEELKGFREKYSDTEALLEDLKQKCSNTEALLKIEEAKLFAAKAPPLTLSDVL